MENQSFYNQLLAEEVRVKQHLSHLQELIKFYSGNGVASLSVASGLSVGSPINNGASNNRSASTQSATFTVNVNEYNKRAVVPEKVLFALKVLGEGTSREVGLKLRELDNSYSEEKAIDDARFHLSALAKEGKISANSVAGMRGNIYRYKKEEASFIEASK
jgi:hypothetical protein